jgi:hypothetical protein
MQVTVCTRIFGAKSTKTTFLILNEITLITLVKYKKIGYGVRTTVDDADDYVLSISAFTEQVAGRLIAQTEEVPASCGCRRVASAWFDTDDFWRLCGVINKVTQ